MKRRLISLFAAAILLCSLLAGVSYGTVVADTTQKLVLAPGTYDDLSTDAYYTKDIRGKWGDNPAVFENGDWNEAGYNWTYLHLTAEGVAPGYTAGIGRLLGRAITHAIATNVAWNAPSIYYEVQPETYIATALISTVPDQYDEQHLWHYDFDVSKDGTNWVSIKDTVSITESKPGEQDLTVRKAYKAVAYIPEGMKYYRITIPGRNQSADDPTGYAWPGCGCATANIYSIGGSVASAYDLTQYTTLEQVPEFRKPVLTAGVYDDLSEEYYYSKYIRGNNYEGTATDLNVPTYLDANYLAASQAVTQAATFMKTPVTNLQYAKWSYMGGSYIYEVTPGDYVAVAIASRGMTPEKDAEHWAAWGFEVSDNRQDWTAVTPAIKADGTKGDVSSYYALTRIPEGKTYLRITLPGYNAAFEHTYDHCPDCAYAVGEEAHYYFGGVFASAYDLNNYDDMSRVPDSPNYVDVYKELNDAIGQAGALNLKSYKDNAAKTAFIAKLAEAKAYLQENHTHEEYIAMANALLAAKEDMTLLGAPNEATILQEDEKHILQPGVADWLKGTALRTPDGEILWGSNGSNKWYITYTDYAKPNVLSKQEGVNGVPDAGIQISDYDFVAFDSLNSLTFMGRPVSNAVYATRSWAACSMTYRVYAGSYVATGLILNKTRTDLLNGFVIQTSADGEEWNTVENVSVTPVPQNSNAGFNVYKAVTKMPEGHTYYRVYLPGADMIDPSTSWYAGNPDYLTSFLGATISSMHDLTQYNSYDDIPDATAYYGEQPLASSDEEKLLISEKYFKLQLDEMTVAQALALLDPTTGSVRFYDVNDTLITDENTKLAAGMTAEILDPKGHSLLDGLGYEKLMVVVGNDLLGIGKLEDIQLDYGAEKTADGLNLPQTVTIEVGTGNYEVFIEWDVESADFDPNITRTQKFTVSGQIILPEDVTNKGGLDLGVTVNVTVNGSTDLGIRVTDPTKARVDEENQILYVLKGMTVEELYKAVEAVGDITAVLYDENGEVVSDNTAEVVAGMMLDVETEVVLFASYEIVVVDELPKDEEEEEDEESGDTSEEEEDSTGDSEDSGESSDDSYTDGGYYEYYDDGYYEYYDDGYYEYFDDGYYEYYEETLQEPPVDVLPDTDVDVLPELDEEEGDDTDETVSDDVSSETDDEDTQPTKPVKTEKSKGVSPFLFVGIGVAVLAVAAALVVLLYLKKKRAKMQEVTTEE